MSAPATTTNHWKLGLFVVIGFALILGTVGWLGARSMRREVRHYVSYFDETVQGLDVGAPVKFRGVTIGTVGKIDVAPDHRRVEVTTDLYVDELRRLGLDPKVGGPGQIWRSTDLRVQLAMMGLTGVKFLDLDFFLLADNPLPELSFPVPENYIPAVPSLLKSLEDSLTRTVTRLPEVADHLQSIMTKADKMLATLDDKQLSDHVVSTLSNTDKLVREAQKKIEQIDTAKISSGAEKTINNLNEAVLRMNRMLAKIDSDQGLLASLSRASDSIGDTVRGADGLGDRIDETLKSVQDAARSIHKLADSLDKDPDMLLKGRAVVVGKK